MTRYVLAQWGCWLDALEDAAIRRDLVFSDWDGVQEAIDIIRHAYHPPHEAVERWAEDLLIEIWEMQ